MCVCMCGACMWMCVCVCLCVLGGGGLRVRMCLCVFVCMSGTCMWMCVCISLWGGGGVRVCVFACPSVRACVRGVDEHMQACLFQGEGGLKRVLLAVSRRGLLARRTRNAAAAGPVTRAADPGRCGCASARTPLRRLLRRPRFVRSRSEGQRRSESPADALSPEPDAGSGLTRGSRPLNPRRGSSLPQLCFQKNPRREGEKEKDENTKRKKERKKKS